MPSSANFARWYVSMKKPRASRMIFGRNSHTPGSDVSIRCTAFIPSGFDRAAGLGGNVTFAGGKATPIAQSQREDFGPD